MTPTTILKPPDGKRAEVPRSKTAAALAGKGKKAAPEDARFILDLFDNLFY
jgi:hypothetical protein